VVGAKHHNLKDLTVDFPLGTFVAVTGVSGSGKSTLVTDILYQALARTSIGPRSFPARTKRLEGLDQIDKVIDIDQSHDRPHAAVQPATYTGRFTAIRELFTYLPSRSCAATDRADSRSMSKAAAARRARATGS